MTAPRSPSAARPSPPDGGLYRDIIVRVDPPAPASPSQWIWTARVRTTPPTTYTFDLTRLNLAEKPDDGGGSGGGNGGRAAAAEAPSSSVVRPDAIKEAAHLLR